MRHFADISEGGVSSILLTGGASENEGIRQVMCEGGGV